MGNDECGVTVNTPSVKRRGLLEPFTESTRDVNVLTVMNGIQKGWSHFNMCTHWHPIESVCDLTQNMHYINKMSSTKPILVFNPMR